MARARRTPHRSKPATAQAKPAHAPAAEPTASPPWGAVALALVGIVWLWAFIQAEPVRLAVLNLLLAPDMVVARWFGDFQQPVGFVDRLPLLLVAAALLLASHEFGLALLRGVNVAGQLTLLERTTLAIGVGLNAISLYTLLVGLAGLLPQRWLIVVPILLAAAVAAVRALRFAWQAYRDRGAAGPSERPESPPADRWTNLALVLAALFSLVILLGSMLPPWDFDVREYHLQVPKEWWRQGQIAFMPHNIYGNMPLGAEMQALAAMAFVPGDGGWWLGALAGKLTMACYAPLTAALLFAAGRRWFSPGVGAWAAVLYVANPWIVHTSVSGLNEPAVAFYVLAAVYALSLSPLRWNTAVLSGFLAGAAAACKYPAVIYAVLPLAALCFSLPGVGEEGPFSAGERLRAALRHLTPGPRWFIFGAFALGSLIGGGAWYAKNAALADNPVYPLAYDVFGGATRTPEKNARWERAHQVPQTDSGARYSLAQFRAAVRKLFFSGGNTSPLLLPLLLVTVALATTRWLTPERAAADSGEANRFQWSAAALLLAISAVWWLATHRIERFWLPALPLASLFAAQATTLVPRRGARGVVLAFMLCGLVYCGLAAVSPLPGDNRWFVSLDALRVSNLTPVRRWLNENAGPGESVLLVGDAEPFELTAKAYYNTCFDDCLLAEWSVGRSARERREALRSRNIAYVYVDWNEIGRYLSPGNYGYDPRWTPELLMELIDQQILEPLVAVSDDGQTLIEAKDRPKPGDRLRSTIFRVAQAPQRQ